jgi:hypothetical protein
MMHEELWRQLIELEPQATAQRAECQYLGDSSSYKIVFLGGDFFVDLNNKTILPTEAGDKDKPAGFLEQLCILAYLISARQLPLAGKLVGPEKLKGGQFFFRGPHALPTDKLEKTFGNEPELLFRPAEKLNAVRCDFGDASLRLLVFPRIPVTFVIWAGDEEFAARASILFDQTAGEQLPLDALGSAVNLAVNSLVKAV